MTERVDPVTLFCHAHGTHACIVCMSDDYYDELPQRLPKERRAELRATECEEPRHGQHRHDLGGESG